MFWNELPSGPLKACVGGHPDHLIPFPVTKVIWEQRETEQGQRQEFQHKTRELSGGSPAFPTQWDQFGRIPRYTTSSHRNKCTLGPKVASIPNPSEVGELDFLHWWEENLNGLLKYFYMMKWQQHTAAISLESGWVGCQLREWNRETWARLDPSSSIPDVQ